MKFSNFYAKFFLLTFLGMTSFHSFALEIDEFKIQQAQSCDVIILLSGEELSTKVLEITPELIKYKRCDFKEGPTISIFRKDVFLIKYANGQKDIINSVSSETRNFLTNSTTAKNEPIPKATIGPKGKANVYIIRPAIYGMINKLEVYQDGKYVGRTKGKQYIALNLSTGKHTLTSKGENKSTITINIAPNKVYYLHQKIKTGLLKARTELVFFNSEQEAINKLNKCKLAKK